MKKNDIFTFTAPNGAEVAAVVIHVVKSTYLCYAQNRLFEMWESPEFGLVYNGIIVEYCILPDYDELLGYTLPDKPDWADAEEEAAKHGYGADEDV